MEKDWISKDRDSLKYEIGVEKFLIYAEQNCENPKKIPCPCSKCVNFKKFPVKIIRGHIYENGFRFGYIDWIWHGAKPIRSCGDRTLPPDEGEQNVDVFQYAFEAALDAVAAASEAAAVCEAAYNNLLGNSGVVITIRTRMNLRARFGVSDSAFSDLLSTVGSLLPQDNVLPVNAYEAKKILSNLGLEYVKFHACPNECVLYRGVHQNSSECLKCHLSRWKVGKDRKDGQMRHPADSPSWRSVDYRWPTFGNEPRNLRLALSADGINLHNNGLTNRYTCWPVVLVTSNLPPWLCMKRKFMMLTTLVSGPHEPGNNIDVFLQPLVYDLKKLWDEGEPNVYDDHTKSLFTLRAILLWMINDFPAYGNLFGCVNKGYLACPVCGDDTIARYLPFSRKICYQSHLRYLPRHHLYRRKKTAFNGEQEFRQPRQPLSGQDVLAQQEKINFSFGMEVKKSKKVDCAWKKKFELEYRKFHHVRHCLDVMHIEKNVCDSLVGTLLNLKLKSKDSEASRLDIYDGHGGQA
nr:PREDICTED: uncharacterized protein LOC108212306 [Daucus carota subsp. sativus]